MGSGALEWLPVTEAVMDRALEVQRLLAVNSGNGHRRPIPDLIIAATAELHGAEVLHVDGSRPEATLMGRGRREARAAAFMTVPTMGS